MESDSANAIRWASNAIVDTIASAVVQLGFTQEQSLEEETLQR